MACPSPPIPKVTPQSIPTVQAQISCTGIPRAVGVSNGLYQSREEGGGEETWGFRDVTPDNLM